MLRVRHSLGFVTVRVPLPARTVTWNVPSRPASGANAAELCPTLSRSLPRNVRLSVGGGGFTVKPAARTPDWPSGFVTVTSRGAGVAAPVSVSAAEICVAETTVVELIVIPAPKPAVAPDWKPRSEERRVGKERRSRWSPYH